MANEIASLIAHTNDLQEAVEGMLLLERQNGPRLRHFLATLHDDDYRYLKSLEFDRMVMYLERRFMMYCNGFGR